MIKTKVADQAWIATALLHRENPNREDFRLSEIRDRAKREFGEDLQPGDWQHLVGHAVASNKPTPAKHRMLSQTGRGKRRLFREGDKFHSERTGKVIPDHADIPLKYRGLIEWYQSKYNKLAKKQEDAPRSSAPETFLSFIGLIPAYDLKCMEEIVEAECEHIEQEAEDRDNARSA